MEVPKGPEDRYLVITDGPTWFEPVSRTWWEEHGEKRNAAGKIFKVVGSAASLEEAMALTDELLSVSGIQTS